MSKKNILSGKNVIVTGGKGFVGNALVKRLRAEGAKVFVWDLSEGMDITDWKSVLAFNAGKKIDLLYHLAAISYVPYSWKNPRDVISKNFCSALNVMEYCRLKKIKHAICLSSYIYGHPKYLPVDEKHPLSGANPYAVSKIECENLYKSYCELFDLKVTAARPFNIYGKGQSEKFVISKIISSMKQKKKIALGNLFPKRDFVYIDDVIDALVLLAGRKGNKFDAFNIGTGKSHSVKQILETIFKVIGKRYKVKGKSTFRKNEMMNAVADITKMKKEFNWTPKYSLKNGIKEMIHSCKREECFSGLHFHSKNNFTNT